MHKNYKHLISLILLSLTISGCSLLPSPVTRRKSGSNSSILEINQEAIKDDRFESVHIYGQNTIRYQNRNYQNDWTRNENNAMQAISLKNLASVDANLANTLSDKKVKGLYRLDGLVFKSSNKVGWTNNALKDGRLVEYDGSYVFKACGLTQDENGILQNSAWFPSPEYHGESLTPDTLFITSNMSNKTDKNGFDENSNPVALLDGTFTAIFATYENNEGKNAIVCGLGLVKTSN